MNKTTALTILCCSMLWEAFGAGQNEILVKPGDTVTLGCDITLEYEIMWFVLRPDATLSVAITMKTNIPLSLNKKFDVCFESVYDTALFRSNLSILNISESDVGLYYCAEQRANIFKIGSGTKLSLISGDQLSTTVVGMKLSWFITLIIAPMFSVLGSALCVFC
ncbi:hypothetical protein J4Q44_G00351090 [Coregonus suidteri]|uniref:Immunoglobulin domain-containing protein n=1 Tax=Coregonus suidteri TaxID=861788 RepID=A0AAN8KGF5_9TELE